MDEVIPMSNKASPEAREEAGFLASLVFESLPILMPRAELAERRKLAADIMMLLKGRRTRMTPELLSDIIRHSAVCVLDQQRRCPLTLFTQVMAWEINQMMGCANEEDAGFRRCSETLAARPLCEERFDGNVRRGHRDDDQA